MMKKGYYTDNGIGVDIGSIPIPSLCLSCLKNQKTDAVCNIKRIDQTAEIKSGEMFCCFAYEPNDIKINKEALFKEMEKYIEKRASHHEHSRIA